MSDSTSEPVGFDADMIVREIYHRRNERRVIWSPSTTLQRMGIDSYPFHPRNSYRRMKQILRQLCENGDLIQRAQRHNDDAGLNEIAYSRVPGRQLHDDD